MSRRTSSGSPQQDPFEAPGLRAGWRRPFDAPIESDQRPAAAGHHDGGLRQGVPLGGFGTGGIGRDWTGAFRRWTLQPGRLEHRVEPAAGFALFHGRRGSEPIAEVLRPRDGPGLGAWDWPDRPAAGEYRALFPKAWYRYPATGHRPVEVLCEQFSPVIPFDLEAASLPVGVFRWHLENRGSDPVTVAVLFTFPAVGVELDRGSGVVPEAFDRAGADGPISGVVLDSSCGPHPPAPGRGEWAVAVQGGDGVEIGRAAFEGGGSGADVWSAFSRSGTLPSPDPAWVSGVPASDAPARRPAGAVSARVELAPGERRELRFVLAWDLPVVSFGSGHRYYRRYTRHVGRHGVHGADLAATALERAAGWSDTLDRWHAHLLRDRPDWLAAMLCNELYLLVDGFTVWTDGAIDGGAAGDFFGVIETPEYPFYDTLDLWSYGSWPLALLWPELARNVDGHYAATLLRTAEEVRRADDTGEPFPLLRRGTAPHDLGSPHEDPVGLVNAYTYRDPSRWKDLNAHFVLSAWRDARHDPALLEAWFPAAQAAMEHLEIFDRDGDGLIENDGWPDQTFDNIPMEGPGVYCGGLWLGALAVVAAWADRLGRAEEAARWAALRDRAATAFEAVLWTGSHYRLDTGPGGEAVFAEQLFGPWFTERTGLQPLLDRERCRRALATVLGTTAGPAGLLTIGGGGRDAISQSDEVMVGINLSVANQLELMGMVDEATAVRRRIHDGIYRDRELWFRTPAAWRADRPEFRAVLNLRPLVVWAGVTDEEVAAFRASEASLGSQRGTPG